VAFSSTAVPATYPWVDGNRLSRVRCSSVAVRSLGLTQICQGQRAWSIFRDDGDFWPNFTELIGLQEMSALVIFFNLLVSITNFPADQDTAQWDGEERRSRVGEIDK